MSSLPLCQGVDESCPNTVEDVRYSHCASCVKKFQQARPKCPNWESCGNHVKYSHALGKNLGTCVDCMPKFGDGCPFCRGFRMINAQTGMAFKTCFHCRLKCPNWLSCRGTRGLSRMHTRYPVCPRCRYGDKFRSTAD